MMPLDCWPSSIQDSVRRSAYAAYTGDVEYASDDLGNDLQAAAVMTLAVFEMASPAAAEDAVAQIKRAEQACATGPSGDDASSTELDAAVRTWRVPVDDPDNPGLAQIVSTTTAEVDGGARLSRLTVSSFAQGPLLAVTGFTASGLDSCVMAALRNGDVECVRELDIQAEVLNLVMQSAIERTTGLPMPDLDREPLASTTTSGDRTTARTTGSPTTSSSDALTGDALPPTLGPEDAEKRTGFPGGEVVFWTEEGNARCRAGYAALAMRVSCVRTPQLDGVEMNAPGGGQGETFGAGTQYSTSEPANEPDALKASDWILRSGSSSSIRVGPSAYLFECSAPTPRDITCRDPAEGTVIKIGAAGVGSGG